MQTFSFTVKCKSTRGVVAAISGYLADNGCNITDSAQFDYQETGNFFMRTGFLSETGKTLRELHDGFAIIGENSVWNIISMMTRRK